MIPGEYAEIVKNRDFAWWQAELARASDALDGPDAAEAMMKISILHPYVYGAVADEEMGRTHLKSWEAVSPETYAAVVADKVSQSDGTWLLGEWSAVSLGLGSDDDSVWEQAELRANVLDVLAPPGTRIGTTSVSDPIGESKNGGGGFPWFPVALGLGGALFLFAKR